MYLEYNKADRWTINMFNFSLNTRPLHGDPHFLKSGKFINSKTKMHSLGKNKLEDWQIVF